MKSQQKIANMPVLIIRVDEFSSFLELNLGYVRMYVKHSLDPDKCHIRLEFVQEFRHGGADVYRITFERAWQICDRALVDALMIAENTGQEKIEFLDPDKLLKTDDILVAMKTVEKMKSNCT